MVLRSITHRCLHCPALPDLRQQRQAAVQLWHDSPQCLRERLLPPRNPHYKQVKEALFNLLTNYEQFHFAAEGPDTAHIFTDGSCTRPTTSVTKLASCSSVSSTHGRIFVAGPLGGLFQSSNRAELQAVIVSVQGLLRCGGLHGPGSLATS